MDDVSFPYESIAFPQMSRSGAFTPSHVYSQADIKEVLAYARLRGIRVIPGVCAFVCVCVSLSVCLSVRLSVCLSVCLSV